MKKILGILILLATIFSCSDPVNEVIEEPVINEYRTKLSFSIKLDNSYLNKYKIYCINNTDTLIFDTPIFELPKNGIYKIYVSSIPDKMTKINRKDCVVDGLLRTTWISDTVKIDYITITNDRKKQFYGFSNGNSEYYEIGSDNILLNIKMTSQELKRTIKEDGKKYIGYYNYYESITYCDGNTYLVKFDVLNIKVNEYNTYRGNPVPTYYSSVIDVRTYIPLCE